MTLEKGELGSAPWFRQTQMFTGSETKFFVKTSPNEVTFQTEKGNVVGVIMKSGPRPETKLKKVNRLRLRRHHAA